MMLNVYICSLRKNNELLLHKGPKIYTPGAIANSQMTPTKINKNGAIVKVRILVEQVIL